MELWKELDIAPGFFISESGAIKDTSGVLRNNYRNGDGYVGASVKVNDGDWITMGVHRLVALTFLEPDRNDRLHVNHLDGDPENNHFSNLEWVTSRENNIHATIMSKTNRYPKVFYTNGAVTDSSLNAFEASNVTGVSPLDIWKSIKDEIAIQGWNFSFKGTYINSPKTERQLPLTDVSGKYVERSVKTKSVKTGVIEVFKSLREAADFHNVTPSLIHHSIPRDEHPRFLKKEFQVAYADSPFQNVTAEQIAKGQSHGAREVIAYNREDGIYVTFKSAKEFYLKNGLSKKSVTHALAKNRPRDFNHWVVLYNTEDNIKIIEDYLNRPI